MKKILSALFLLAAFLPSLVLADNRGEYYYGLQPPSAWLNATTKNPYVGIGQLFYDLMGRSQNGTFTNLTITSPTGLYITVAPAVTNTYGSVYQVSATDTNTFGAGGPFATSASPLPADPLLIYHQGLLSSATGNIGPLTAPTTSGQSVIDVVECQVVVTDAVSQLVNFVSPTNVASQATVNRERDDAVVCQIKAGTAAATPTTPTVDTGFVGIGTVTLAYGATTISAGNISVYSGFAGFLPAGSATTFVDTTTQNQQINAAKQFNYSLTHANSGDIYTGTVSSYPSATSAYIIPDGQSSLGLLLNTATGSNGIQFLAGGSSNGASVTAAGVFKTGSSTYGPTSAAINGTLSVLAGNKIYLGGTTDLNHYLYSSGGTTGNTYLGEYATSTTGWHFYNTNTSADIATLLGSGNFNLVSGSFTTGSSTYGPTSAVVAGPITSTSLTAGQCLTANSSNQIVSAGGACGLTSGTISQVNGTGNIVTSTTSGIVTVSETAQPTFTNPIIAPTPAGTSSPASNAGSLQFGSDGNYKIVRTASAFQVVPAPSAAPPSFESDGGFIAGNSTVNTSYATIGGIVTATNFDSSLSTALFDTSATGTGGTIALGNAATNNLYGTFSSTGLVTQGSTYGANATINGSVTVNNSNVPTGGGIAFGTLHTPAPYAVEIGNNLSTTYGTNIATNGNTVSGVAGTLLSINIPGNSDLLTVDGTGDLGIGGSFETTSGSFLSGSSTYGPTSAYVNGSATLANNLILSTPTPATSPAPLTVTSGSIVFPANCYVAHASSACNGGINATVSTQALQYNFTGGTSPDTIQLNVGSSVYGSAGATVNGMLSLTPAGTASSFANFSSNLLQLTSSYYNGSTAVNHVGAIYQNDTNSNFATLQYQVPSNATQGGFAVNMNGSLFIMGITAAGYNAFAPSDTSGYSFFNNAQSTQVFTIGDTGNTVAAGVMAATAYHTASHQVPYDSSVSSSGTSDHIERWTSTCTFGSGSTTCSFPTYTFTTAFTSSSSYQCTESVDDATLTGVNVTLSNQTKTATTDLVYGYIASAYSSNTSVTMDAVCIGS